MTDKIDLIKALDLLPRYNSKFHWNKAGKFVVVNITRVTAAVDEKIHKLVKQWRTDGGEYVIRDVDVSKNLYGLHMRLRYKNLRFLARQKWRWQKWPSSMLPCVLIYKGETIMWDGHHRSALCRLAGVRLTASVIDLDKYLKG